jgi:hypothetical protein
LFLISDGMLKMQAKMLNTKLCILHYGNNAIPYIKNEQVAEYVGNELKRLFVKFRNALPGVSILVVSGGDMGRTIDGVPQSYPYAGLLAEKQVAHFSTCIHSWPKTAVLWAGRKKAGPVWMVTSHPPVRCSLPKLFIRN